MHDPGETLAGDGRGASGYLGERGGLSAGANWRGVKWVWANRTVGEGSCCCGWPGKNGGERLASGEKESDGGAGVGDQFDEEEELAPGLAAGA